MILETRKPGRALTCGWLDGEPVWFDAAGLPVNLADLRIGMQHAADHRASLIEAIAQIDRGQDLRRAIIARLEALEARGE